MEKNLPKFNDHLMINFNFQRTNYPNNQDNPVKKILLLIVLIIKNTFSCKDNVFDVIIQNEQWKKN